MARQSVIKSSDCSILNVCKDCSILSVYRIVLICVFLLITAPSPPRDVSALVEYSKDEDKNVILVSWSRPYQFHDHLQRYTVSSLNICNFFFLHKYSFSIINNYSQ